MFTKLKKWILNYLKKHLLAPLSPTPINKKRDFIFRIMFLCFSFLCVIGSLIVGILIPEGVLLPPELPFQFLYTLFIGCSLPFVPKIFVKTFRVGKVGYSVGKNMTTEEYVEINQVSDNQYRATYHKTHSGDIIAIIVGVITFMFTWIFYVIFGPFLLGYKIYKVANQIYEFKRDMVGDEKIAEQ